MIQICIVGAAFPNAIHRVAWLAEGRNTKFCIVAEGGHSGSRYSATRAEIWRPASCDTAQEHSETYCRRATQSRSLQYGAQKRSRDRGDTEPRYGQARPTTQPGQAYDTTRPGL